MLPGLWMLYYWSAMAERDNTVLVLGSVLTLLGLRFLWRMVRPFRFVIGPSGLDVRTGRVKAAYGWDEIRMVTLSRAADSPATLDVTPVGADRPIRVLSLADVADSQDEVAQALARFGGSRFVDLRPAGQTMAGADFNIVLRGYDPATVDTLLVRAEDAMASRDTAQRETVAAALSSGAIPIVMRGYDRDQVDAAVARFVERLSK